MRKLHSFPGGIHPPDQKDQSTGVPIAPAPLPQRLVVPLSQHMGAPAKPVVATGERVLKGQVIGEAEGSVSANVHAPSSGTVTAIELRPMPHPSGLPGLCVAIEPDGEERWIERAPIDWRNREPAALAEHLRHAGIVGLGGAVFPSAVKARPGRPIDTLVLNGAECEPYITCDDLLMREHSAEIVRGIQILNHMVGAREVLIGIEDNKPEAIAAMRAAAQAAGSGIEVAEIPTLYPAGGEKQLVKVLTGREVPSGGLPRDLGVVCFNIATACCVSRAVERGEPMVSRIVTVTGNVAAARNYEVLLGTPVEDLAALARPGADTTGYIMGGPMMGFRLPSDKLPVVKATNCIIAASAALFPPPPAPLPCIRCGRCAEACPASLQPMDLYWFLRVRNFDKAERFSVMDCIECACCDYVCPSHIPLVDYFRFAKSELRVKASDREAAALARERHEFRQLRLEREREERAARLASRAPAAAKPGDSEPVHAEDAA